MLSQRHKLVFLFFLLGMSCLYLFWTSSSLYDEVASLIGGDIVSARLIGIHRKESSVGRGKISWSVATLEFPDGSHIETPAVAGYKDSQSAKVFVSSDRQHLSPATTADEIALMFVEVMGAFVASVAAVLVIAQGILSSLSRLDLTRTMFYGAVFAFFCAGLSLSSIAIRHMKLGDGPSAAGLAIAGLPCLYLCYALIRYGFPNLKKIRPSDPMIQRI